MSLVVVGVMAIIVQVKDSISNYSRTNKLSISSSYQLTFKLKVIDLC